jgi:RNA polymerase sigma-70 factor (ECF subfamily)
MPASATDLTAWLSAEVLPHEHRLRRYLRGRFSCVRDVDDVIQDAYIRIMRAHARRPVYHARQLLYTIARRLALDVIRRQRISPFVEVSFEHVMSVSDEAQLVPERAARRQEKQILGEALLALTERRRTALELTRFAGLSGREAGDLMGVSEATVNNHVRTAVLQCRLFFRERGAQVAQPL